jgi:hypothetical protein
MLLCERLRRGLLESFCGSSLRTRSPSHRRLRVRRAFGGGGILVFAQKVPRRRGRRRHPPAPATGGPPGRPSYRTRHGMGEKTVPSPSLPRHDSRPSSSSTDAVVHRACWRTTGGSDSRAAHQPIASCRDRLCCFVFAACCCCLLIAACCCCHGLLVPSITVAVRSCIGTAGSPSSTRRKHDDEELAKISKM